ncbi:MAG: hypothetical protein RIC18_07850 [Hoeflea sp.]|uniref:hypothetical protein n=1 Tax=Hoeflea sp. TaxID=1940281 RepID=UPI0032ED14A9
MNSKVTHWDPVEGEMNVETPDISTIREGIVIPPFLKRILPIAAVISMIWVMAAGFLGDGEFPFIPVGVTTLVWVAFLEHLR